MKTEHLTSVIKKPVYTEKSSMVDNQYVFVVDSDAQKSDIKKAIELLFSVEVTKVNVMNYKPIKKFFGRRKGVIKAFKKAYITLKEGQSISLSEK